LRERALTDALAEGIIYPVLHRLEAEGLLASSWSTVAGRRRRVYRLTRPDARARRAGRCVFGLRGAAVAIAGLGIALPAQIAFVAGVLALGLGELRAAALVAVGDHLDRLHGVVGDAKQVGVGG
jgi:hypothetical protein